MFDKILIANRGEIACRVARTARRMGVRSVAVYSDADAGALHVEACDEAYRLGPSSPRESYLRGDRIIDIALRCAAEAIHPGYGFLSENADFAAAVAAAGLTFIGPPPGAIRAMGSKSESKRIVGNAGIPIVPGYHAAGQDDALLISEADRIGYPVLIKASAGGGGKGMRIVERRDEFIAALASARREAKSAFGDDSMLLEKYLTEPRHIEIQVFADTHGECVHLFERDCSVQRRHQKVLEESPAPGMTRERRAEMGAAAVATAKAIGYVGAGTVEFIVDRSGAFHFMEMNTRLQVEHPVTELVTGLDLVEWQLRVAAGEPLPLAQDALELYGHAIEARIYAEDPSRDFLPSIGRIAHLRMPPASAHVRIDSGIRAGDEISQYYDPMIAKLVAWGEDRGEALRQLRAALAECQVAGVATNIAFLQRLVAHEAFASGHIDTGLIARYRQDLLPPPRPPSAEVLALAAVAEYLRMAGRVHLPW
jgi:3-methylcrotonyl-CoA carboxylase alpha subunit